MFLTEWWRGRRLSTYLKQLIKEKDRTKPILHSNALPHQTFRENPPAWDHFAELVQRPGKYHGEAPYVPYFWNLLQLGAEGEQRLDIYIGLSIWKIPIAAEDKALFPELSMRKGFIYLIEMDNGYVTEVFPEWLRSSTT